MSLNTSLSPGLFSTRGCIVTKQHLLTGGELSYNGGATQPRSCISY
jgi:hypothetical protein